MRIALYAAAASACALFGSSGAYAQSSADWASCIVANAPVSAKSWIDLGGPNSKLGDEKKKQAGNLGFRLKAICASRIAPNVDFEAVRFEAKSVFKALQNLVKKSPTLFAAEEPHFEGAGVCSVHFLVADLDKVGDDAQKIDRTLVRGAAMAFTSLDLINPAVPNPSLISAKQSNGAPMKIFRECLVIRSDGSLKDA